MCQNIEMKGGSDSIDASSITFFWRQLFEEKG